VRVRETDVLSWARVPIRRLLARCRTANRNQVDRLRSSAHPTGEPSTPKHAHPRRAYRTQLPPAPLHKEAQELGWKEDPTDRLQDPRVNVALGVHHLRGLPDQYEGDVVSARRLQRR
jgi:hypothetical protein